MTSHANQWNGYASEIDLALAQLLDYEPVVKQESSSTSH
jgi:hypothetical protein